MEGTTATAVAVFTDCPALMTVLIALCGSIQIIYVSVMVASAPTENIHFQEIKSNVVC
jgi:hypothetical protein